MTALARSIILAFLSSSTFSHSPPGRAIGPTATTCIGLNGAPIGVPGAPELQFSSATFLILVPLLFLTALFFTSAPRKAFGLGGHTPRPPPRVPSGSNHSTFESALTRVIELLPGQDERDALLLPIEVGREQRLRELAVRARRYKTLLDGWEGLHDVDSEDRYGVIHDNIIQQLRLLYDRHELHSEKLLRDGFAQTVHSYETFRYFLSALASSLFPWTAPYFSDHTALRAHIKQGGRGIVFAAGSRHAEYLLSSIPTLRELGCDLPIEVMYLGDADLSEDYRARLEGLGAVTTRNLAQMIDNAGGDLNSYASKPFSILLSSFREVLFIDADNFFSRIQKTYLTPRGTMRLGRYSSGTDEQTAMRSRFWTGESAHEQESGLILVDKWRHFISLLLAARLNGPEQYSEKGGAGIYEMVHGDKETFWLSWELAGDVDYSFHPGVVGGMGFAQQVVPHERGNRTSQDDERYRGQDVCKFCSSQLLHMDAEGMPLWVNGWILKNKNKDAKDWEYGEWEHYAAEPSNVQDVMEWDIGYDNHCCLTVACSEKGTFTGEHQALLRALINKAMDVSVSLRGIQTDEEDAMPET
ncbi:hypothetical protein ACCO45_000390 [Purpureocillium lilacinum]|uniref:Uncharacterized protein n=1 Tax=Purpureocillium lilacinum TaxID=33203 RepID=A0ACC4E6W8_PURLI